MSARDVQQVWQGDVGGMRAAHRTGAGRCSGERALPLRTEADAVAASARTLAEQMSDLDDEFPLGDGVADLTTWVVCPYCGEEIELGVDPGGGTVQEYVEDCEVCCRPLQLTVSWDVGGAAHAVASTDDDA